MNKHTENISKKWNFQIVCTARNASFDVLKMPSASCCAVLVFQCFITQSVSNILTVYLVKTICNDVY